MTIAFISDLHISAKRPSSIMLFTDFMDKSGALLESVYILGDLFDFWIGDDGSQALGYSLVEQALKKATDGGTKVYFIAGNRDFLVGTDFAERTGVQLLDDMTILEIDDQRIMIAHGDRVCIDDTDYMQARATFTDPAWQADILSKSIEERKEIAEQLRALSEETKSGKPKDIMDVNKDEVKRVLEDNNIDILIHGHTHRPYVHSIELSGRTARRYVLGEWLDDRSVVYGNQGKYYLKK
ncbi:MAG: UDP-2,3-diacylglucosamine diphosphatase [Arenicellales bacterium]